MNTVFLKLLSMSITAGWLILAVIFLRLLFKKAPKWLSCVLWAIVARENDAMIPQSGSSNEKPASLPAESDKPADRDMDAAVAAAILSRNSSSYSGNSDSFICCDFAILDRSETSYGNVRSITLYGWTLYQEYLISENGIEDVAGSHLLDIICSSPKISSNPLDYIKEHDMEYRELLYYGGYTLDYYHAQKETGLRNEILRLACEELS